MSLTIAGRNARAKPILSILFLHQKALSRLKQPRDSQRSGVKPPKTFPPVSKMRVSLFARPSHRP
jgi:hypothetical protein